MNFVKFLLSQHLFLCFNPQYLVNYVAQTPVMQTIF